MGREGLLAVLYAASAVLSVVTVAASTTVWLHWSEILDNCASRYCGCILNGESSPIMFSGGEIQLCHFASFAPLPVFAIALILSCYYGYKACMYKKVTRRTSKRRSGRAVAVARSAAEDPQAGGGQMALSWWLVLLVTSVLCCLLLLAAAGALTAGYHASCSQYRETAVRELGAVGDAAAAVYDRLSCGAIFDIMDFVEPHTRPFLAKVGQEDYYPLSEQRDRYRGDPVDTGGALMTAIVSSWLNSAVWLALVAADVKLYGRCKCC
ncbi:uncharacterized protein LOC126284554 isoform X1 [Schistocerca gregaria]|uniref:uncharacterized protein LOC126284554 isoform X1 n=1 Tax=Schistocerca gregaria TaxID=7010 RepID=UPI00211E9ADB|nr:uncharacterized protein LOC126284554 isoform X1 [Schistocerca gregaria]